MDLRFIKAALAVSVSMTLSWGDVGVSVADNGLSYSVTNNTSSNWKLGGVRFANGGFSWTGISGVASNAGIVNENNILDVYLQSTSQHYSQFYYLLSFLTIS